MVNVLLVILTCVAAGALAWLTTRCQHVDEYGQSLLSWTWHDGMVRGYCPTCQRFTSGWSTAQPQYGRKPIARIATVEEVTRFRAQRAARQRLQQRMAKAAI